MEKKDVVLSWTAKMDSRMNADVVVMECLFENGQILQKYISFADFRSIIDGAADGADMVHVPKLPHGYLDGYISSMDDRTFRCTVLVPGGKRVIRYYEDTYEVPYPATVFSFCVDNGRLKSSRAFFVKDEHPTDATILYQYCFANVGSNEGQICWGSNVIPHLDTMQDCNQLVALFFGSPCNDDYYSYDRFAKGAPRFCKTQRALYEHLLDCEVFPFEILAATPYCVADLLK